MTFSMSRILADKIQICRFLADKIPSKRHIFGVLFALALSPAG